MVNVSFDGVGGWLCARLVGRIPRIFASYDRMQRYQPNAVLHRASDNDDLVNFAQCAGCKNLLGVEAVSGSRR